MGVWDSHSIMKSKIFNFQFVNFNFSYSCLFYKPVYHINGFHGNQSTCNRKPALKYAYVPKYSLNVRK